MFHSVPFCVYLSFGPAPLRGQLQTKVMVASGHEGLLNQKVVRSSQVSLHRVQLHLNIPDHSIKFTLNTERRVCVVSKPRLSSLTKSKLSARLSLISHQA